MSRSKIGWNRVFGGLALALASVVVLLIAPTLASLFPNVEPSSLAELAVQIVLLMFSLAVLTAGLAMIASNGTRGGPIWNIGKRFVVVSGAALLVSYVDMLLVLLLVLAPINQGALLLGFGLALLLGVPSIKPATRVYLEIYRNF